MRLKHSFLFLLLFQILFFLFSCESISHNSKKDSKIKYVVVDCPAEIREKAVFYAERYVERETEWVWGGRDYLEKEGVLSLDCSGIIVCIYQYATIGTKYSLLFGDAPLSALYEYFTIPIEKPKPGDIIFMGTENNKPPTHISIFVKMENDNIFFIDSTLKEEDGINGVTLRYYSKDDPRLLYFARLLVKENGT